MADPDKAYAYPGPPTAPTPDPAWRPPQYDAVPAPRELPAIDHAVVDEAERRAARLTYAVGLAALAILLIVAVTRLLD